VSNAAPFYVIFTFLHHNQNLVYNCLLYLKHENTQLIFYQTRYSRVGT